VSVCLHHKNCASVKASQPLHIILQSVHCTPFVSVLIHQQILDIL